MPEQPPPVLERLAGYVPGYAGYRGHDGRRATDRAWREAIARRLGVIRARLDREARASAKAEDTDQVRAWRDAAARVDGVVDRVLAAAPEDAAFHEAGDLAEGTAEPLHEFDLLLFDRAEELVLGFEAPELRRDLLPGVESDLADFDRKLDRRAAMLADLGRSGAT